MTRAAIFLFASVIVSCLAPAAIPSETPRGELPIDQRVMTFKEVIVGARLPDADGDRVSKGQDNGPAIASADQKDTDGNGIGDACQQRLNPTAPSMAEQNRIVPKTYYEPESIHAISRKEPRPTKITGVVVAYNNGIVLTAGPCRQLLVVRAIYWGKDKAKGSPHVLVRRDYPCDSGAFPAEMFQAKKTWEFNLIRDSSCDHSFEEIKDIVAMNPASAPSRIPNMKIVPGDNGRKMPTTVRFACYQLAGGVKAFGKRAH